MEMGLIKVVGVSGGSQFSNFFLGAYVQEVRFSGGGLKITRPKCIHLFSGGGQVSPGVS